MRAFKKVGSIDVSLQAKILTMSMQEASEQIFIGRLRDNSITSSMLISPKVYKPHQEEKKNKLTRRWL